MLFLKFISFLSVISLILLSASVHAHTEPVLKLRSDLWCPYACEPGPRPGVVIEIVEAILSPKYKIDYSLLNWARAVSDTREGIYDGIVGAAVEDAPDFIFPKEAQALATFEFFTLKSSSWKYTDDLAGKKIGVINSYTYDEKITKLITEKPDQFVVISGDDALEKMVKMLLAGRIDALYENPAVFKSVVERLKMNESDFTAAGAPVQKKQKIFVAFSPKKVQSKKLTQEIDQGMKKLRKSGELEKILKKYGLKDPAHMKI